MEKQNIFVIYEESESVGELNGEVTQNRSFVGYVFTEKEAKQYIKKHKPIKGYFDSYSYYEYESVEYLEK